MSAITSYTRELAGQINNNPGFMAALQADPQKALAGVEREVRADLPDTWIYRIVVLALGITIVGIAIGVLVLMAGKGSLNDTSVPAILTAIGSASVGALAGLLAPSPRQ